VRRLVAFYRCYWSCLGLQKGAFQGASWQIYLVGDDSIKSKQSLIQQLREVAEKETAWLEKNRLSQSLNGLLESGRAISPVYLRSLNIWGRKIFSGDGIHLQKKQTP